MPNNRGGIPMYNENPQYSATISSQLPQGSPASFGTGVAKEMAGMGDAIGKWGTNLVKLALEQQEKADDNYVMRRENEMRKALNELMYNPQTGLTNQKLHNAQGVTMAFDDEVEKLTQQFMSDVNNPNLQAKFQQRIGQWIPGYRTTVAKHEGDETFNARKTDYATNTKDQMDEFLTNPTKDGLARYYQGLQFNKEYLVNTLGLSPAAADEEIQSNFSKGVLTAAEKLSGVSDTQGIMDLWDYAHGKVSAETEAKLAAMAGKLTVKMDAEKIAAEFLNDPECYINGVFSPDLAKQKAMKNYGPGAVTKRRRFVGGKGAYFQDQELNGYIDAAAKKYQVDPLLVAAMAAVESNGNQGAISSVGAIGVMQLMSDTAASLGVDPNDKKQNVEGGAKYLKQLLDTFGGDVRLAIAAYNAGPQAVKDAGNQVPNIKETQNHVAKVTAEYEKLKSNQSAAVNVDVDSAINKAWDDYKDKSVPLPEGTNGCAHAANYFVAYFNPWSKGQIEKGGRHMSYVPQLVKDAQEPGAPGVESFSESNLQKGDMIVYKAANDPEGMNHVVVYAGNGAGDYRFVGNSSSANDNQGGLIQGNDYRQMGTPSNPLTPQYIIKTSPERGGTGGGQWIEEEVSSYNPEKWKALNDALDRQGQYSSASKNQRFSNAIQEVLQGSTGLTLPSECEALAQSVGQKYNLTEQDISTLYKASLGNRVNKQTSDQQRSDTMAALSLENASYHRAEREYLAWENAHLDAPDSEKQQHMANCSPEFINKNLKAAARATTQDGYMWYKNPVTKKAFNNAVAQNQLKGEQITNAMDIVAQEEKKNGGSLSPDRITAIVNEASANRVIYQGKWYERNVEGRRVDYPGGVIGKDRNGIDVTSEDGLNYVSGVDEEDFEE